ncbi:MAG: cell division protein FtsW [Lachnospiraceae bacterium]|nr:cell division protein FtsW [Lachnospiraceae bacterium]
MNRDNLKVVKNKTSNQHYDYTMLVLVGLLVCFGLIMVCSASAYTAVKYGLESTYYLKRQGLMAAVGIIAMIGLSKFDYHLYTTDKFKVRPILILYFVCVILQIAVFIVGSSTNGSTRWLQLPIIGRFQPSELSKFCIIIMVAFLINLRPRQLDSFVGFVFRMLYVFILAALVLVENLSTAIIMIGIAFIVCFVASRKWAYFFISFIVLAAGALIAIFSVGYRADRITQWLDVENEGYQILQGLYAICSGGWFGKGLGNSVQKLGYIPEVHTDMIFSVICEELGILGVIILLTVYVLLLWRIFKIIVNAPDLFGSLLCTGVFAHIALQVILNVAVVTNTVPSTGVTLPFISYGGTSLIVMLAEMGIVINVSSKIEYDN